MQSVVQPLFSPDRKTLGDQDQVLICMVVSEDTFKYEFEVPPGITSNFFLKVVMWSEGEILQTTIVRG